MARLPGDQTAQPGPLRFSATLLIVVVLCALARPAAGAPEPESNYALTAVLELGAQFLPDRWVPVRLELTNRSTRDVDGFVSMPAGAGASSFIVRQPCRIPARSRVRITVPVMFADPQATRDSGGPARSETALSRVDWLSAGGERLAVTDLHGTVQADAPGANAGFGNRSLLLFITGDANPDDTEMTPPPATGPFAALAPAWLNVANAPRQRAAYDACRFVVLQGVHPDMLDVAQREALLQHMLAGAVVIVPAPNADTMPAGSWLDPYWPVEIVGHREFTSIAPSLKLRSPSPIAQALPRSGEIILRDASYVHAAYQRVGLGRVAFTSFPIGALDPASGEANQMWSTLLGVEEPDASWAASQLAADQARHLEEMIGVPTAPWSLAAIIVLGYLGAAVVVLITFTGPRRPAGFVTLVAIALVGAAALAVLAATRPRGGLTGARLATLDLAPTGGGIQQEVVAFVGADLPALALTTADRGAALHPAVADASRPPDIQTDPFSAPAAGARAATVERLWRATRAVNRDTRLQATAQFGPNGLSLSIDNQLRATLRGPVLLWTPTGAVHRLGDVAEGQSPSVPLGPRNVQGDYGNAEVVASESAKLRGAILRSAATPSLSYATERSGPPVIAGWLDDASLPPVLGVSAEPAMRTAALFRTPLGLRPSDVGTRVAIDGAFVRLVPGAPRGLPYDEARQQWIATAAPGQWVIGFAPPKEIGRLRPKRVTLTCDPAMPQQVVRIRGDQAMNATGRPNLAGRVIAEWSKPIERQQITFEPQPQDVDANGHVWLMLSVDSAAAAGAQWLIRSLEVAYDEADVTAPIDAGVQNHGQ